MKSCFVGIYALRGSQIVSAVSAGVLTAWGMSKLFYDSVIYMPLLMIPIAVVVVSFLKEMIKKNRLRAAIEFQELMEQMSAGLYAGNSLEHSYIRGVCGLKEQHPEGMLLMGLWEEGVKRLRLNVPIVQVLEELANRTGLEDVEHFARVTLVAQRNGGNLIHVIAQATGHISEKIKTDHEIEAIISAKKMEQSIMCVMPFVMMLYVRLMSPQYFDVLYHNAFGVVFMTACLSVIFVAYLFGRYLVDIKV